MGIYAQVFKLDKLKWVNDNIFDSSVHEHVSLYFYQNTNQYKIHELIAPRNVSYPEMRIVLDYEQDYIFLTKLYENLHKDHGLYFGIEEIIEFLNKNQELLKINESCIEKKII